ncbi:MAG: response regulator [Desulfobacteraceae bacterium]|jgi:DNA-binding NtrC family response regulator
MSAVKTRHPAHDILVMEDEATVAKGLEMVLSEEGYRVALAATGQDAISRFDKKEFDLLVADLRLPDMNGMDVIKMVKEKYPRTEVVVITGYSSVGSVVTSMQLGAYDYLPKPFTEDQIKESIRGALEVKAEKQVPVARIKHRVETEEEKLIQKREVIRVLNRTAEDMAFWADLMAHGSEALQEYQLSSEARAAISSGDLNWLNANVGELTQKQLMFIFKRLEREAW